MKKSYFGIFIMLILILSTGALAHEYDDDDKDLFQKLYVAKTSEYYDEYVKEEYRDGGTAYSDAHRKSNIYGNFEKRTDLYIRDVMEADRIVFRTNDNWLTVGCPSTYQGAQAKNAGEKFVIRERRQVEEKFVVEYSDITATKADEPIYTKVLKFLKISK
ncbi:MAG: hypothetical protein KKF44_04455 [Nanoarchaeota archaeon]|nr:hypothetical protein [Nanoarchaeota archaeon]